MDAVERATCGHPGTPMGVSELTLTLWANFLRFDPARPDWRERDRFVLSAGHASMLLYSMLHLFGYDCSLDDLKNFRQYHARTAGHPEYGYLPGIETTTGPLGQGVGNAVGLAMAQALLAGRYPSAPEGLLGGRTWCLAGDGCLMEGVAAEAASLAGHLKLSNLIVIYDQNKITIDGSTDLAFTEDVGLRFTAYGWQVLHADAYDQTALCQVFEQARSSQDRPTLVIARSMIGKGAATMAGSHQVHGAALGAAEIAATRKALGWGEEPFAVPAEVRQWCARIVTAKQADYGEWKARFEAWMTNEPVEARLYQDQWEQQLDLGPMLELARKMAGEQASTRKHSGRAIQGLAELAPWFVGGSADLAESNCSSIKGGGPVQANGAGRLVGRNIHFGVREHGMAAVLNGMALHGAWRPYGATFFQFSDYMRPSIRLAALMKIRPVFLFTHDSVLLGEDGPTHQPVEHLSTLRLIPGLSVWRPADGLETAMAWAWAVSEQFPGPSALVFSRQTVPLTVYPEGFDPLRVWDGAYVLQETANADLTLVATGSELGTAVAAARLIEGAGKRCRVVSMPSACVFSRRSPEQQREVLGSAPIVVVEAGSTRLWPSYVGARSLVIGVDEFGLSAPEKALAEHFGLTPGRVAERALAWMGSEVAVRA